jgi:hypothetical protein
VRAFRGTRVPLRSARPTPPQTAQISVGARLSSADPAFLCVLVRGGQVERSDNQARRMRRVRVEVSCEVCRMLDDADSGTVLVLLVRAIQYVRRQKRWAQGGSGAGTVEARAASNLPRAPS